ncbi:MAG: beta-glucanase precursor [Candidatus Omnitrophica bacterium]|nr:beta-glucanase precursor [Candidatus Omnitrophota bacterium]
MKKLLMSCFVFMLSLTGYVATVHAYEFGDFKSSTLVSKAWGELEKNNLNGVLAYTNKCIEMYAADAAQMQAGLKNYVSGDNDEVFKQWALNDVATSYFIQGEAYLKAGKKEESKQAYSKVVNDFTFGQCWDSRGWFWKPAEAAQKKLTGM